MVGRSLACLSRRRVREHEKKEHFGWYGRSERGMPGRLHPMGPG